MRMYYTPCMTPGRMRCWLSATLRSARPRWAGAIKYGVHNVDKGIPTSILMDSAMRHAAKYLDEQEDEDHLLAAAWNVLWAIEMRCKKPECVDTPWRDNAEG